MKKEVDGMGTPDIKYGDSVCYIQHVDTSLWLTYQTIDPKCVRMGGVQRKVLHTTKTFPFITVPSSNPPSSSLSVDHRCVRRPAYVTFEINSKQNQSRKSDKGI